MRTDHILRETMGENIMSAAVWASIDSKFAVRKPHAIYTILGDQRSCFNLSGDAAAPATCHETVEASADK
jgi:hypothetical protein